MTIFDEEYKVVAVESQKLVIRGVLSGNVLVIKTDPEFPKEAFPVGQLITLSDPAAGAPNNVRTKRREREVVLPLSFFFR